MVLFLYGSFSPKMLQFLTIFNSSFIAGLLFPCSCQGLVLTRFSVSLRFVFEKTVPWCLHLHVPHPNCLYVTWPCTDIFQTVLHLHCRHPQTLPFPLLVKFSIHRLEQHAGLESRIITNSLVPCDVLTKCLAW